MTLRNRGRDAASRRPFVSKLSVESLEVREVPATVGGLDPSFNGTGTLAADFGGIDTAAAVAIQADGKIVVAGTNDSGVNDNFVVARYNPDGTPDTTFDGDGKQSFNFVLYFNEVATSVTIQDDGKIVVAGYGERAGGDQDFLVGRLHANGQLDESFGTGGKADHDFNGGGPTEHDRAYAVTTQFVGGERKVVLVGVANQLAGNDNFALLRLNDDGTVQAKRTANLGGTDVARAVAIDGQNRIVVAGDTNNMTAFGLAMYDEDGTFTATFHGGNPLGTDFGGNESVTGLAIQSDDKIVVVGTTDTDGNDDFALARFDSAGVLDATFGTGGRVIRTLGKNDVAGAVAIQSDGKIVVVGHTDVNSTTDLFGVMRLNPDGSFDASFDGNGKKGVEFGGEDRATAVAIDNNGRIVIAGSTTDGDNFALARLIGTVEEGKNLAVGGGANGAALIFAPQAGGVYPLAPTAAVAPFNGFNGNVRTAVADVDGDGIQDTIVATGPGATRFAVVSGADNSTLLVAPTDPFNDANFTGGLFVAGGDLDGDGRSEIIVSPDQGGGPRVTMFSLVNGNVTQRANFFGIDDASFRGGARVATGDVNGDGVLDVGVAAGFLGGPRVALFDGKTVFGTPTRLVNDFFGFPGSDATTLRNGAFLSLGDVDGDGNADLVLGGGPGGAPRVFILSGAQIGSGNVDAAQAAPIANFFVAGNATDVGGVRVAAKDADGDHKADVAVGSGDNASSRVRVYLGNSIGGGGEPAVFQDLDPYTAVLANGIFVG